MLIGNNIYTGTPTPLLLIGIDLITSITDYIETSIYKKHYVNDYSILEDCIINFKLNDETEVANITNIEIIKNGIAYMISQNMDTIDNIQTSIKKYNTNILLKNNIENIYSIYIGEIAARESITLLITYTKILKYDNGGFNFKYNDLILEKHISTNGCNIFITFYTSDELSEQKFNLSDYDCDIKNNTITIHIQKYPINKNIDIIFNCNFKKSIVKYTDNNYEYLMLAYNIKPSYINLCREYIFIIDGSGSMSDLISNIKKSLTIAINMLPENSYFNIIYSGNTCDALFNKSVINNKENITEAIKKINKFITIYGRFNLLFAIKYLLDITLDINIKETICIIITNSDNICDLDSLNEIKNDGSEWFESSIFGIAIGPTSDIDTLKYLSVETNGYSDQINEIELKNTILKYIEYTMSEKKYVQDILIYDKKKHIYKPIETFEISYQNSYFSGQTYIACIKLNIDFNIYDTSKILLRLFCDHKYETHYYDVFFNILDSIFDNICVKQLYYLYDDFSDNKIILLRKIVDMNNDNIISHCDYLQYINNIKKIEF